jgi:hypothetical protein
MLPLTYIELTLSISLLLVLVGCILLTKSLLCNVAILIGMSYISESSQYLEFMSLIRKKSYYDKF